MTVVISELEKGDDELYMPQGNLDITMVYLSFSLKVIHSEISAK